MGCISIASVNERDKIDRAGNGGSGTANEKFDV